MGSLTITAPVTAKGPAAAFVLTEEQVAAVGEGAKRFPAVVTVNGETLRSTVTRMRGEYLFGLSRASRTQAGLQIGDVVTFTLSLDTAPREVDIPDDLRAALDADPAAGAAYAALAYTHRTEFARWVAEAKREDTRVRRVKTTLEMLHAGRTRS